MDEWIVVWERREVCVDVCIEDVCSGSGPIPRGWRAIGGSSVALENVGMGED